MRTLRLDIEYDGSGFSGWARQPGLRTVEGEIASALHAVLGGAEPVLVVAGRTDAGVHASGQVASAVTSSELPVDRIDRAMWGVLPSDVAVRRVTEAPAGFDARRDALSRRYEYRLLPAPPSPLRRGRVLRVPTGLDIDAMNEAAARVVGQHDFRAFTPTRTEHVFFDRTVSVCRWETRVDEVVLTIEADAFLRHMVRVLVGTFLLVGQGRRDPDALDRLLAGAPRAAAGPTAPAHALTLTSVGYPAGVG